MKASLKQSRLKHWEIKASPHHEPPLLLGHYKETYSAYIWAMLVRSIGKSGISGIMLLVLYLVMPRIVNSLTPSTVSPFLRWNQTFP